MLVGVTITGADDDVRPEDLAAISYEFPFVEWGILFSRSRVGTPRYPSLRWVSYLESFVPGLRLAAHVCGSMARDTAAGMTSWLREPWNWPRAQINGIDVPAPALAKLAKRKPWRDVEWVLQTRDEARLRDVADFATTLPKASALFDPSGGRGIEPERWPTAPAGLRLGYAGGITPSSVEDVLTAIGEQSHDFWIDMESGVRDSMDRFDLGLVRQALDAAAGHVKREPPRAQIIDLGEALKRSMR